MSNKERIGVILDVSADVGKIEGSLSSLRNHLSGIQLPKGIGKELETRMSKLSDEIKNFQNLASKAGDSFEGAKQIDASYKKILEYARKVENSFSAIKDEAKIDASKFFPKDVLDRIEKAEGAMADYYKAIEKGNESLTKQRKELKDIESALDKNKKKQAELLAKQSGKKASRDAVVQEQTKVKTDKTADLSKERETLEILNKRKIALDAEKAAVENLAKKREAYNKVVQTYSSKQTEEATTKIDNASAAYAEAEAAAKQYGNTIRSISEIKIEQSNVATDIATTKAAISGLGKEIEAADTKIRKADEGYNNLTQELKENEAAAESFEQQMSTLRTEIEQTENAARAQGLKTLAKTLEEIGIKVDPTVDSLEDIQNTINNLKPEAIQAMSAALDKAGVDVNELGINLDKVGDKNKAFQEGAQEAKRMNDQVEQLKGQVQQFFSLTNSVMLFRRGVQQAIETVKELDAAMTETAVVTDFNVSDMWDALPRYTQTANELGTTTLGAYETMTLFYQQGLDTNEAFEIGTETMKMARIAGLEYADATNLMTAALRGFNMELNATSAERVNDVYSELAAITAADTEEIATAMTKTASIAANANMEFETTAALLSQIIETTREPAETAGTAMKTIIARFTEMKKATSDLISIDGEEVSVNKVEDALRSAGVALRDVNGEFRDLDDVFLELSSKWNSLDKMTQRYIATMAAGSRQQSRFIAMMSDYDRTMELVGAAYDSSGASQKQFEKTQDSLESKLNKLKNAWDEFLMGISNSTIIKAGVDALTGLLNIVNKLTGNSGIAKLAVAIGALKGGKSIFEGLFRSFAPFGKQMEKTGADAGAGLLKGLTQRLNNFKQGKPFTLDVDVDTKGLKNKINTIKSDLQGLKQAFTEKIEVFDKKQVADANIEISSLSHSMKTLMVEGDMAGEVVEHSLSEVGTKAILAAQGIEEGSEEAKEFGIEASVAIEAVEKQYEDLIAKAMAYQAIADDTDVDVDIDLPDAKDISKKDAGKKAAELFDQADDLLEDKQALTKMKELGSKSGMVYKNALGQSIKGLGTKIGGTVTTGLSKFASLFGATGAAAGAAYAGAILAAVAAVAGTIYAVWYNSGLQVSKRLAEAQAATLEDTRAQTDALTTQVRELDDAWEKLTTGSEELDGMVQGTIEWTQKVQELNAEVQALLEKYPELYKYLNIDKATGQWTLDKEGYQEYEEKTTEELNENKNRELYETAMSNYLNTKYEEKKKASQSDYIWNWMNSEKQETQKYEDTMKRAYLYANGKDVLQGDLSAAPSLEEILSDPKTREYIDNLDDSSTHAGFWGMNKGNADPRTVLKYYDTMSEAEQQLKAEEDAYVRNYLASQGTYGAQVQEAVAQTMYDLPSMYEQLEQDQTADNRSTWWALGGFDGKTGGAGAKMQGDGNDQGRSVQQIMEDRGYELVDKAHNYYKNKYTGEYVNVDVAGGGGAGGEKKTKTVNGEEVEMETWSNEYIRDLGRQDELRRTQEKNMQTLATTFAKDSNLAKIASGDLSADITQVKSTSNIVDENGNILFDYQKKSEEFQKNRAQKMDELNKRYGNVFQSTGTISGTKKIRANTGPYAKVEYKTVEDPLTKNLKGLKTYEQKTYEAAQSTIEFEDSIKQLGTNTSQYLTSTYLALMDLENPDFNLNTLMDLDENDPNYYLKQMTTVLNAAGVSASNLKDYVGKIDMSSAINGARQLKQDLKEGGEEAAMASAVLAADTAGDQFFSVGNQFKELISGEQWMEKTQAGLSEIYKLEGKITADNIRELAEENSDLAAVLDTNSLKASGFAKMMEAVEEGTLSLSDVTSDLIELYDDLYYTADLAGEAIARLESVEIGKSDTEIGKIYSESWAATQDLIDRGAYGDSQIDDYMNQMVGESTWINALAAAGGDKTKARETIDKEYGLSQNQGNLYGSWIAQMKQNNNSIADGAFTMGKNGKIDYDLSKVKSTEELVEKMMKDMGVTKEYAETMLADMKTYSKTFSSDLDDLDKRGSLDKFLNSRITAEDRILNISEAEKAAFAKARGESIDEFEKYLKSIKDAEGKFAIKSFEDRQYSKSGYYYSAKDEKGNKRATFTDKTAETEIIKQAQEAMVDSDGVNIPIRLTNEEGGPLNPDLLNSLIGIDTVREIMLDPNLSEEEKLSMLQEIEIGMYGSTKNGIAQGLLSEETITSAQTYSEYMGTEMYNKLGGYLCAAMDLLAANEVFIPMDFSLPIGIPQVELFGHKFGPYSFGAISTAGAGITIGGKNAGFKNGPFTPKNTSYTPKTLNVNAGSGGGTGGKGTSYEKGNDEDNAGGSGGGGSGGGSGDGGGSEEKNDTDPRNVNLDKKIEALDRKLERREVDAVEHQFAKDALYLEKKMALQAQKNAAEAEADYLGKYYKYDEETDAYLYLEDAYNKASDETKNKIDEEINKLQGINDELNEIEDAIEDLEFKNPYDEQRFYQAEGQKMNAEQDLAHIERQRGYNDRYSELVGKLPSEVQGPLNMALIGSDMMYEAQEIQANQRVQTGLEEQMRSKYSDSEFAGEYYHWDERTQSFKVDEEKLSDPALRKETRDAILAEYEEIEGLAKEWREVSDELYGGFIQDAFNEAGEAAEDLAISFINDGHAADNINDIFDRFEKKLGLNEDALDGFGNAIGDAIDSSELLSKTFKGFGIENVDEKINQSPIGGLLSENQKSLLSLVGGEGGTFGELGASLGLNISDALGGIGSLLNFDMMSLGLDMFNGMMGMVDQGKQMVEKIIGYITQATQVIVDAWTNREDYLYNFLKIIEKHLQEYEKLQRYSTQLEKGRLTSSQDILNNWNDQWKSLQLQLEEQQERLETRQKELERSRWNPFSLISGWNPSSDTLYENREVKFLWDLLIGFGQMAPMGLGAFFSQLNQLYEDYDQRVQNSYEDRLAAEQAILDIEDERLELVKVGSEEATEFEQKILDAMIQKEQEQIDELTRLNDAITDANSKLISTLQDNLDKMRQERENEKKEEELGEKERRLAYLRQDTSGANMLEIKKLEEQLEDEHEDYTDTLIDQKISELEKQNEKAADQRQQQIDLLQSQLDYAEKYGLYWDAIYGMLYTIDENGNAILNPENFDLDGNIRENSQLAQMLGTFSDRLGMSVWSAVLDNEEVKRLGRYYGAFIGMNGVDGNWANYWALQDPGADDPNYAYPEQEIPKGLWGVLYRLEIGIKKYFANSDPDLIDRGGRINQAFKKFFGKLFGNEEWENYEYEAVNPAHVQSTTFAGMKKLSDDTKEWFKSLFSNNESYGNKTSRNLTGKGAQNIGDINTTNYFQIGNVGETISLDEMVDRVAERFKDMFSIGNNVLGRSRT